MYSQPGQEPVKNSPFIQCTKASTEGLIKCIVSLHMAVQMKCKITVWSAWNLEFEVISVALEYK
jgi:hypothetical protein